MKCEFDKVAINFEEENVMTDSSKNSDPIDMPLTLIPTSQDGGDLIFTGGAPGREPNLPVGKPGNIIFKLANDIEVMRIAGDGKCFVNGNLVANDKDIFDSFSKWLASATMDPPEVQ